METVMRATREGMLSCCARACSSPAQSKLVKPTHAYGTISSLRAWQRCIESPVSLRLCNTSRHTLRLTFGLPLAPHDLRIFRLPHVHLRITSLGLCYLLLPADPVSAAPTVAATPTTPSIPTKPHAHAPSPPPQVPHLPPSHEAALAARGRPRLPLVPAVRQAASGKWLGISSTGPCVGCWSFARTGPTPCRKLPCRLHAACWPKRGLGGSL